MIYELKSIYKGCEPIDKNKILKLLQDKPVLTDADRLELSANEKVIVKKCFISRIVDIADVCQQENFTLQYLGFCCWSFVHGEGILVPGNPHIGICEWKNKYFVFSNAKAAESFACDPEMYHKRMLNIIRSKPELITLFQMKNHFLKLITKSFDVNTFLRSKREFKDVSIQTAIHLNTHKKVSNYSSNLWDLRRRALKMASMTYGNNKLNNI